MLRLVVPDKAMPMGSGSRYPDVYKKVRNDNSRHYFEHDERDTNVGSGGGNGGRNWRRDNYWGKQRGGHNRYDDDRYHGQEGRRGGGGGSSQRGRGRVSNNDGRDYPNRLQDMYERSRGRGRGSKRPTHPPKAITDLGWHKIIVRNGAQYPKEEILRAIRNLVEEPFIPISMDLERSDFVFYLEDNGRAARAITEVSRRIAMPNGHRLVFRTNQSVPPIRKLTPLQLEKIKLVMSNRYSPEMARLNLKNFHNDPELTKEEIFCPLYRAPNMTTIVGIIISHIPEVCDIDFSHNKVQQLEELKPLLTNCHSLKRLSLEYNRLHHVESLKHLTGLHLTELVLEGNEVCNKYNDPDTYISAVRKYFPKLQYLDGHELPKTIGFEVDEDPPKLPPSQPAYFCDQLAKGVAIEFIRQYYQIFDTPSRTPLLAAYTDDAVFSLSTALSESKAGARLATRYVQENRNLKKVTSPEQRQKTLIKGNKNIIDTLSRLPGTVHDPGSFVIDIPWVAPQLMHVVLSGLFCQDGGKLQQVRSFTRSLIIVKQGEGYCILNEELFVTYATASQVKSFKSNTSASSEPTPVTAPAVQAQVSSPPPVPVAPVQITSPLAPATSEETALAALEPIQVQMIKHFSQVSGMRFQYSRMCLQENQWDYEKAGQLFLDMHKKGQVPAEYFKHPAN
ncbi:nuclear RNA export factor 1-like [Oratosquilla oratoria]|uniref:nuclear RNA export factor 1-like n=1 Tax=Oratosquilla oratoria TaxID=337810 RepID=UPI003F757676